MNNITTSLYVALAFLIGFTLMNAYAQNGTDTDPTDGSLGTEIGLTMGVVGSIVLAIISLVKTLADKGYLPKVFGTNSVIASDTAHAVLDTRIVVEELANAVIDVLKVDAPEQAAQIEEKLRPVLKAAQQKVTEYQPKVDKFAEIANKLSNKGENTVDAIKEDEQLKASIPNDIVPTEEDD